MSDYRIFGPKVVDHPSIGRECPVCNKPFREGDFTVLVGNEPGSAEDREKMLAGRPYTAKASEVHASHVPSVDLALRAKIAEIEARKGEDAITLDPDTGSVTCNHCAWFVTASDPESAAKKTIAHFRLAHPDREKQLAQQWIREGAFLS